MHNCTSMSTAVTEAKQIPRSVCNRIQERKSFKMCPICLTESDNYYFDEIKHMDNI